MSGTDAAARWARLSRAGKAAVAAAGVLLLAWNVAAVAVVVDRFVGSGDGGAAAEHLRSGLDLPAADPVGATAAAADSHSGHDGHGTREASPGMSVALRVVEDPTGGWTAHADTAGFRFAPESVSLAHADREGHVHWYLNGVKQGRVYGEWFWVAEQPPGNHELSVELSANDHAVYTHDGEPIRASVTLSETPAGAGLEHDHDHTVKAPAPTPSVSVSAHRDPAGGWLIRADPSGFRLAPSRAGTGHVPGEGHMMLYVDGVKTARMYSEWQQLPDLAPGVHEVKVALRSNDTRVLQADGSHIAATVTVSVEDADVEGDGTAAARDSGAAAPEADGAMPEADGVVVVYSDGRFSPQRVTVTVGETVTFVNRSDQGVWPASNIHPTHDIYPEFDPLRTLWPGESWQHTFDRAGTWRYHNHVGPDEIGTVVVTGDDSGVPPLPTELADLSWPPAPAGTAVSLGLTDEATLLRFVADYGPAAAMKLLSDHQNSNVGYDCHQPGHVVGRHAYELWGAAVIALTVHECQSGVLHGAMEALFAERGTARLEADIVALCAPIGNDFKRFNCYHGLGHGLMAWTSYELHEALSLCDLAPDDWGQASCWSGVFMENIVGGLSGLMGHTSDYVDADDPLMPCDVVAAKYVATCYNFQTSHMLDVLDRDYAAVAELCLQAPQGAPDGSEWHYDAQWQCFASLGRDISSHNDWTPRRDIDLCGHAPEGRLRDGCVSGLAQNRFWDPSGAQIGAAYCNLHAAEADTPDSECHSVLIDRAGQVLDDRQALAAFCGALTEPWAHRCAEQHSVTVPTGSVPVGATRPTQ